MLVVAEPRTDRLAHSPLKLVVCQVRFPQNLAAVEPRVGLAVQEALGGRSRWRLDAVKPPTINISTTISSGAETAASQSLDLGGGWRLVTPDSAWIVTLMADSVALETIRYEGWNGFLDQLGRLLETTQQILTPEVEERLGLRYINRIEDPVVNAPADWRQWIRPEVLGLVGHPTLGAGMLAAQQQVSIDAGEGTKANIRQGFARNEARASFPYVLDIDTYRDEIRPFDLTGITQATAQLNRLALSLFQLMITDDLYRYLHGEP